MCIRDRVIIGNDDYLVSPADGEIIKVEEVDGPKEVGLENKTFKKISIFMNVFDCHVNRTPCSGKIEEILYKPGKFLNASLDKASEDNERNYYNNFSHYLRSLYLKKRLKIFLVYIKFPQFYQSMVFCLRDNQKHS